MNIKEYVDNKTIKLDLVTVKFELILWDKKGEKLYTEVGLMYYKSNRNNDRPNNC